MWDYPFEAKFHGESNGDSLDALKWCFDPKMAHKGLIGAKIEKFTIWTGRKVKPTYCGKILRQIEWL